MPEQQMKLSKKQKKNKRLVGPVATVFNSVKTGDWRILKPIVNYSLCSMCSVCNIYCPTDAIEIKKDTKFLIYSNLRAKKCIEINWNYCKGCGMCANVCPKDCITMIEE